MPIDKEKFEASVKELLDEMEKLIRSIIAYENRAAGIDVMLEAKLRMFNYIMKEIYKNA